MSVGYSLSLVCLGEYVRGGALATWRPGDKEREVPGVNMGGWNSC